MPVAEPVFELSGSHGPGYEVALRLVAPELAQHVPGYGHVFRSIRGLDRHRGHLRGHLLGNGGPAVFEPRRIGLDDLDLARALGKELIDKGSPGDYPQPPLAWNQDKRGWVPTARDGGQFWLAGRADEPKTIQMVIAQGRRARVLAHAFGPDPVVPEFSYIAGDLTQAYVAVLDA